MNHGRGQRRFQVDIPVEYTERGASRRHVGRATDVSLGGARIETKTLLPFGTKVTVHMRLPGASQPVALPAIVRWTHAGTMGVQFGGIGVRETRLITQMSAPRAQTLSTEDVVWLG